jgi:hypothetical protein
MSFQLALQTAVFERLSGYSGLPNVHQHVEQRADSGSLLPFPYVVIGDDTHIPFDTDDASGAESTLVIHTWSREKNRSEVKTMQGIIYEALHRYDLEVDGYHVVTIDFEFDDSITDPDRITQHGVQRFRILMHEL